MDFVKSFCDAILRLLIISTKRDRVGEVNINTYGKTENGIEFKAELCSSTIPKELVDKKGICQAGVKKIVVEDDAAVVEGIDPRQVASEEQ